MKFISHIYSSHKKLASTSKTLIKISSIARSANFESSPFVLQTSYVLRTSIAPPATDRSTLIVPGVVTRVVRDNARPGTAPLLFHSMMEAPPTPPPSRLPPPAATSLPTYGASNAPVAETAEATEHPSTTGRRGPTSVPHGDCPDPGTGVPLEVRDVHEDLAPMTGGVRKKSRRGGSDGNKGNPFSIRSVTYTYQIYTPRRRQPTPSLSTVPHKIEPHIHQQYLQ